MWKDQKKIFLTFLLTKQTLKLVKSIKSIDIYNLDNAVKSFTIKSSGNQLQWQFTKITFQKNNKPGKQKSKQAKKMLWLNTDELKFH